METQTPKRRGPRKKSPAYFQERYADICAAYLAGWSLAIVAEGFAVSRQRIHQIVTAACSVRTVKQPKEKVTE